MEILLNPTTVALLMGIAVGVLAAWWLGSFLFNRAINKTKGWSSRRLRVAKVIAGSIAAIAIVPSFLLAFGTGDVAGAVIGESFGIGGVGVLVGLTLGLAIVFVLAETTAILLGLLLAAGISRLAA